MQMTLGSASLCRAILFKLIYAPKEESVKLLQFKVKALNAINAASERRL